MKRKIYELLTIKHKIIINNDALDLLSKSLDTTEVQQMIPYLKTHKKVDLPVAQEAVKRMESRLKSVGDLIEINNFKSANVNRIEFLSSKIKREIARNVKYVSGTYKHMENRESIMVGDNEVLLNFSKCFDDHFLINGIFVNLAGRWGENEFFVENVILPDFGVENCVSNFEWKILIFNDFDWQNQNCYEKLSALLDCCANLGCIVFIGSYAYNEIVNEFVSKHNKIKHVFVPSRDELFTFLPKKLDPLSKHKNAFYCSNPFEITVDNFRIGIVKDDVFKHHLDGIFNETIDRINNCDRSDEFSNKVSNSERSVYSSNVNVNNVINSIINSDKTNIENDCNNSNKTDFVYNQQLSSLNDPTYFGNNHLLSPFLKTLLSQHSFNPFCNYNLTIEKMFNLFVVAQDCFSCLGSESNVRFASIENFDENGSFLEIRSGECFLRNLFFKH